MLQLGYPDPYRGPPIGHTAKGNGGLENRRGISAVLRLLAAGGALPVGRHRPGSGS